MKKIISLFIIFTMIMGTMCFPVFADSSDYISADFEDGTSPFTTQKGTGSAVVVDAAQEGIGTDGKVLKLTGTGGTYDAIALFDTAINPANPIIMETRFMHKGNNVSSLFTLNVNIGKRVREWGVLTLRQNEDVADNLIGVALQRNNVDTNYAIGGENTNGYFVNEDGTAFEFEENKWYKMRAIYQLPAKDGTKPAIPKFEVYDDAGALVAVAENLYQDNDKTDSYYPTATISDIGFRTYKDQTLYVDDVFVYNYKALEVASSYQGTVDATNSVTIPFNLDIDGSTVDNITVTSQTVAAPAITSKTVSGKNLTITFAENLANGEIYNINLAGVKSAIGSTLANPSLKLIVKPEMTGAYIDETFEDNTSPFTINNKTDGSAVVVDAAQEGVGTSGKILKIIGNNNAFDAIAPVTITTKNPVVMEARFMHKNLGDGISNLFTLNLDRTSRIREYGILTTRQVVSGADLYGFALQRNNNDAQAIGGENKNGYLVNTDGSAFEIAPNTWYKMKAVYQIGNQVAVTKLEVYNDAGVLVASAENLSHLNDLGGTTVPDISGIGFRADGFSSTTQTLYVDNVFVYDYKAPEALKVTSSYQGIIDTTNSVTIPFNLDIDDSTLENITVTSPTLAAPAIASKTVSGKNLTITFVENLVNDGIYNISLAGVKSKIGTTLANSDLTLKVKPKMINPYIDETFESGNNEKFTLTNRNDGSVEVVDAAQEGIGTNGKVLKIMGASSGYDAIAEVSIASGKTVVMEANFMHKDLGQGISRLFTLNYGRGNRERGHGILAIRQTTRGETHRCFALQNNDYDDWAFGGENKNGYLVNNDGSAVQLAGDTWYKMRVVYQIGNQVAVAKLEVYDDEGELVASAENISQANDIAGTVVPDITRIGFCADGFSSTTQTLYVDNVFVYDYETPVAFALESSSIQTGAELMPSDAKEITLDFNNLINSDTLDDIMVTADGVDVDFDADLVGDSTQVKIILNDALVSGKDYMVDYSALLDANGSSVTGNIVFTVKAGQFVNGVTFDKESVVVGTVNANVSITNSYQTAGVATLVAALYDIENNFVTLEFVTLDEDMEVKVGDNNLPISITVPAGTDVENAMIQVMVLESIESLKPMTAAAVLK